MQVMSTRRLRAAHIWPAPLPSAVLHVPRVLPTPPPSLHQLEHLGESEKTVLCLHLKENMRHRQNMECGGVSSLSQD